MSLSPPDKGLRRLGSCFFSWKSQAQKNPSFRNISVKSIFINGTGSYLFWINYWNLKSPSTSSGFWLISLASVIMFYDIFSRCLLLKKMHAPPLSPDFMNWRSGFLQGSLVSSRRSKCVTVSTFEDPQLWQPPRGCKDVWLGLAARLTSICGVPRVASPINQGWTPNSFRINDRTSLPRIPRIFNVRRWVFCGCFIRFYTTCVSPRKGGTSSQLRVLAPKNCGSSLILLTPTTPKTKSSINHPFKPEIIEYQNHFQKPSTPKSCTDWCSNPTLLRPFTHRLVGKVVINWNQLKGWCC